MANKECSEETFISSRALDEYEIAQRRAQFEIEMDRVDAGLQTDVEAFTFLRHLNEKVFDTHVVLLADEGVHTSV